MLKGDFNGDDYFDLLTGNEDSQDLTLLINQQDGTFRGVCRFPCAVCPTN